MDGPGNFEAMHRLRDEALARARLTGPGTYSGDGIVMVAGGGRHFVNAYVSLTILRKVHGCTLPVQVWHLGPDEMSQPMRAILQPLDVELIDVLEIRRKHPMRIMGGWECKPYAVLHSPFERVLLIDADNVPLRNPAYLFERPEFARAGALFWPDISKAKRSSPVWDLFGVEFRPGPEFESGQLVVDKRRTEEALHLAVHYCSWSDIYWKYVNGDKQTFQMAWQLLNLPYELPAQRPTWRHGTVLTPQGLRRYGVAFEQPGFEGEPLFHHRVGSEWVLFGNNIEAEGAEAITAMCMPVLDELRHIWDGRVLDVKPAVDFHESRHLTRVRRYLYRRLGIEERFIEFEPDGRIGPKSLLNEQRWRIEQRHDQECLVISRADTDMCELKLDEDGCWRGSWLYYEQQPVELIPVGVSQ